MGGVDQFVAVGAGRSLFRVAEPFELTCQRVERATRGVKKKKP